MNDFPLLFAAITFALGMFGYAIRHRAPRTAKFLICLMIFGLGTWMLISTYQLYGQGEAHVISRHSGSFKKIDVPESFELSVFIHGLLGIALTLWGTYGMVTSITSRNVSFYR